MRSLNCLLVHDAHSVPLWEDFQRSGSLVQKCVWQKKCCLAAFLDMHLDLVLASAARNSSAEHIATETPTVLSSSSRRCHIVTSSTGPAASQWGPPLEPDRSFNRAVSLRRPDRQCSRDDSQRMRAQEQVEAIDRTLGSNYEWNQRACSKEPPACLSLSKTELRLLKSAR